MSIPGVAFRDRAAYLEGADALVLADLHIGRDATSNVDAGLGEHEDLTGRFAALLSHFAPREAVLAGDVLHSFSHLPRGAEATLAALTDLATTHDCRLVVTPGNHDGLLGEVWDGPSRATHTVGEWAVCHGHEAPTERAARYVVGHDHPALRIEGRKHPCYLYAPGHYEGGDVLVVPAFSRLSAGVTINRLRPDEFASPLVRDPGSFRPVVRDEDADETLVFPPLARFRRLL
jgi:metallophosphoesterase superfamily enzyme